MCDSNFRKHPQNDGPAQGLDIDLILKLQDYTGVFDNIWSPKIVQNKIVDKLATVKLLYNGYEMNFTLIKQENKWVIDTINGDFTKLLWHY